MRSAGYLLIMLFVLALAAPNPVRPAKEAPATAGEKAPAEGAVIGGRGEGFEPEAEATRGPEIPATFGPLVTDTAIPMEKGKFAVQPTFSYSFITDSFTNRWGRASTGGDFQSFGMDWKLTYGLIENLEVFVVIPYVHNWAARVKEPGPGGETSADSGGLGDLNLTLKYRLVEETGTLPTVSALFATDFPTGKFKNLSARALGTDAVGCGAYVFTAGFNVSKYIAPFIVYGNLWYSMPTGYTDDEGRKYPGDFVTVNLAAEYPITPKWAALLELTTAWGGGRLFGPGANVPHEALVSILPAIEYMATEKFSIALGVNVDLIGKNTDAAVGPVLSMVYAF
ncbi:MAG: transporter [Syntrophobacteraceae bacterium]